MVKKTRSARLDKKQQRLVFFTGSQKWIPIKFTEKGNNLLNADDYEFTSLLLSLCLYVKIFFTQTSNLRLVDFHLTVTEIKGLVFHQLNLTQFLSSGLRTPGEIKNA